MGKINRSIAVVLAAAALSACGGGGGGDSVSGQTVVTPSAVIDDSTATELIASTFSAPDFSARLSVTFLDLVAALYSISPIAASADAQQVEVEADLANAVVVIADRYLNLRGEFRVSPTAVVNNERVNCDSGFFVFDATIQNLASPTAGDRLEIDFRNCNGVSGVAGFLDGGLVLRIVNFNSNRFTLALDFDNLRLRDALYDGVADGDLRLQLPGSGSSTGASVTTIGRLSVTEGGVNYVLNGYESTDILGSTEISTDGSGDIRSPEIGNEWISFLIQEDFVRNRSAAYPRAGVMVIFGADDSSIRLTVLSDSMVQIEIDADGDTVYESLSNADWSTIRPPAQVF